jgi:hypothetical protein
VTEEQVNVCESGGIGLLLEKRNHSGGVFVLKIQPGGSAWSEGSIEVGDECLKVDADDVLDMDLRQVASKLIGPAGSDVKLRIRRMRADGKGGFEWVASLMRCSLRSYFNPRSVEPRRRVAVNALEGFRTVENRSVQPFAAAKEPTSPATSSNLDTAPDEIETSSTAISLPECAQTSLVAGQQWAPSNVSMVENGESTTRMISSDSRVQASDDSRRKEQENILKNSYKKSIQLYNTPIVRQVRGSTFWECGVCSSPNCRWLARLCIGVWCLLF